jgi:hypothetical protein
LTLFILIDHLLTVFSAFIVLSQISLTLVKKSACLSRMFQSRIAWFFYFF